MAVEQFEDEKFGRFKKLPLVGIPGIPQAKVMSLQFEAGDPRNEEGPEGRPGNYRVAFTLSRPGMRPSGECQLAFERQMGGDSHLALGAPFRILEMEAGTSVVAKCLPNEHGFLGKIVIDDLPAAGFADAERRSHAMVSSALTNLGVLFEVPLHIYQCEVEEARTGKTKLRFVAPYLETPPLIEASCLGPSEELQACGSFYREALVSSSVLYQYLCFFKVTESVDAVRKRAQRKARKEGRLFSRPAERFPAAIDVGWLNALYYVRPSWDALALEAIFLAPVLGKTFAEVLGKIMKPLRNEVAHAIADSTNDLTSADDIELQYRAIMWLPPLKMMARRMLKDEFPREFLVGVADAPV